MEKNIQLPIETRDIKRIEEYLKTNSFSSDELGKYMCYALKLKFDKGINFYLNEPDKVKIIVQMFIEKGANLNTIYEFAPGFKTDILGFVAISSTKIASAAEKHLDINTEQKYQEPSYLAYVTIFELVVSKLFSNASVQSDIDSLKRTLTKTKPSADNYPMLKADTVGLAYNRPMIERFDSWISKLNELYPNQDNKLSV